MLIAQSYRCVLRRGASPSSFPINAKRAALTTAAAAFLVIILATLAIAGAGMSDDGQTYRQGQNQQQSFDQHSVFPSLFLFVGNIQLKQHPLAPRPALAVIG
jgi:hypothetical protein